MLHWCWLFDWDALEVVEHTWGWLCWATTCTLTHTRHWHTLWQTLWDRHSVLHWYAALLNRLNLHDEARRNHESCEGDERWSTAVQDVVQLVDVKTKVICHLWQ
jgi:hypothetical protein